MTIAQRGDPDRAEPYLWSSIEHFRTLADPWGLAMALASGSSARLRSGRSAEAAALVEESIDISRRIGDRWNLARAINFRARQAEDRSDYSAALADWEEAVLLARTLGHKRLTLNLAGSLRHVYHRLGRWRQAAASLGESLTVYAEVGSEVGLAVCLTECGNLAAACGDRPAAARFYGAAAARDHASGPLWTSGGLRPRSNPDVSRMLETHRQAAGQEAAWQEGQSRPLRAIVAEAVIYADAVAAGAITGSATDRAVAPAGPCGLTEREIEVLRLLAAGRSNREIAEALVISVRTAEHHVAGIYQKIDAAGPAARAAAAAFAVRQGLAAPPAEPPR